jgi:hypothetical protein
MPSGFGVLYSCGCAVNPNLFACRFGVKGASTPNIVWQLTIKNAKVLSSELSIDRIMLTTLNPGHRGTTARREFCPDLQIPFKIHLRVEGVCSCADKPMLPIVAICDNYTVIKSLVALSNQRASMLS